eukprot:365763-Chlamydomonas_euryale.AAC.23
MPDAPSCSRCGGLLTPAAGLERSCPASMDTERRFSIELVPAGSPGAAAVLPATASVAEQPAALPVSTDARRGSGADMPVCASLLPFKLSQILLSPPASQAVDACMPPPLPSPFVPPSGTSPSSSGAPGSAARNVKASTAPFLSSREMSTAEPSDASACFTR